MVIHKFPIKVVDRPVVEMDPNGRIVKFDEQHGHLFAWAIVDPEAKAEPRYFQLCSTGYAIRPKQRYIGTAKLHDGDLVFHLWEELGDIQVRTETKRQHPETVGHKPHGHFPVGEPRPLFNRGGAV